MKWFEHQRIRYTLNHYPIPREVWERLMREADIFRGLSAVERAHLRELTEALRQYPAGALLGGPPPRTDRVPERSR